VKDRAASVAGTSVDEATSVVKDAKGHLQDLVGQSRSELATHADEQARRLASAFTEAADEITGMAQGRAPAPGIIADVTSELGSGIARLGHDLDERGLDGALREVKDFARRRPGVFLLAALGAGVACGRLLRNDDTHALMQAAKPTTDGAGSDGSAASAGSEQTLDLRGME
jgi:hypothetical protein